LIISPLTSYTDQIISIQRAGTSAGFSLDIPLIMLCASILKVFYWPGARYDVALLVQALIMIAVQVVLLKVRVVEVIAWFGNETSGADGRLYHKIGGARQPTGLEGRKPV
jgi:hypothetical protein